MKIRHVSEVELSAYIDEAAEDPLAIAEHLTVCVECSHRYNMLRDLSATLHALPEPEVRPEFLTRVIAHVRETEMEPARAQWLRWMYNAHRQKLGLIAAGGCLIAALAVVFWTPSQQVPQAIGSQDVAVTTPAGPTQVLVADYALAEMPMDEMASEVPSDMAPLSDVDIILALSNADWIETADGTIESHMDTNTDFSEENNAEAEDIVFDFLQEGSMS